MSFRTNRSGKLVLQQTAEEKLEAIRYIQEKNKAAELALQTKKETARQQVLREQAALAEAKAKTAAILASAGATTGGSTSVKVTATGGSTTTVLGSPPPPVDDSDSDDSPNQDEKLSDDVQNVEWPFNEAISHEDYSCFDRKKHIFRFPGQMYIPKALIRSLSEFRTFFSPSDMEIGKGAAMAMKFKDTTQKILFRETAEWFITPDFFECFTPGSDSVYDIQQTKLSALFKDGKIPVSVKFYDYFVEDAEMFKLEDLLTKTEQVDEMGNPIYSYGNLILKGEQVTALEYVHQYYSKPGRRHIMLKLGTGVGKTFTALLIAKMLNTPGKIAVIANTSNQIPYWIAEIAKIFPGAVALDHRKKTKGFVERFNQAKFFVFSQKSCAYTDEKIFKDYGYTEADKKKVYDNYNTWYDQFDICIVDECHEMVSKTKTPFKANFCNAYIIGLSATPDLKETTRRTTFLYYGNIISAEKLLAYAATKGVTLKSTKYEYKTIYNAVNYEAYPVYTEIDDCVKGRISMRKEEVPLPQCLTAKMNADIHRIYAIAYTILECALEGRCVIGLSKTVDYLYMLRDAIQRLVNGEPPIMLHDPEHVLTCRSFATDYPTYLKHAVIKEEEAIEVEEVVLRYKDGPGKISTEIRLGGEWSKDRYECLRDNSLYNKPIIISSKYKNDWGPEDVAEAISKSNIILSTVQSLGTGYNIEKADTVVMIHSVIMQFEQCVGRMKRKTTGKDRHGFDFVDSSCGVLKSQFNKRVKRFYNNHSDELIQRFYYADDIVLKGGRKTAPTAKKVSRQRIRFGEEPAKPEPTPVETQIETPVVPEITSRIPLPDTLRNYKASIDVVPQALKMERLERKNRLTGLAGTPDSDEEADDWGE